MPVYQSTRANGAIEEAIAKYRSLSAMARALGLSGYQVIQEWRRQGRVPAEHCPEIEKATGVRCERLNSKIDWAYLRGTCVLSNEIPSGASQPLACDEIDSREAA